MEDNDADERVILIQPRDFPTSSSPSEELNENSTFLMKSTSANGALITRGSSLYLRWTLGALLIVSGVVLKVSMPIYTVCIQYGLKWFAKWAK